MSWATHVTTLKDGQIVKSTACQSKPGFDLKSGTLYLDEEMRRPVASELEFFPNSELATGGNERQNLSIGGNIDIYRYYIKSMGYQQAILALVILAALWGERAYSCKFWIS